MATSNDLQETLKPFHQRASDAEERLTRLEAAFATTEGSGNTELSNKVTELQRLLEDAKSEQLVEREKLPRITMATNNTGSQPARTKMTVYSYQGFKVLKEMQQVIDENAKLRYRITHLVRALEKADGNLALK